MMLSAERLRELLEYNPLTGVFYWRVDRRKVKPGTIAGTIFTHGGKPAIGIRIDGRRYQAHRLAFLWMTGEWPVGEVDHRDRDPLNNRWDNLRVATRSQNAANQAAHSDNCLGLKGVWPAGSGSYQAMVTVLGKRIYLGTHSTAENAHAAYIAAATQHFGEFARAA